MMVKKTTEIPVNPDEEEILPGFDEDLADLPPLAEVEDVDAEAVAEDDAKELEKTKEKLDLEMKMAKVVKQAVSTEDYRAVRKEIVVEMAGKKADEPIDQYKLGLMQKSYQAADRQIKGFEQEYNQCAERLVEIGVLSPTFQEAQQALRNEDLSLDGEEVLPDPLVDANAYELAKLKQNRKQRQKAYAQKLLDSDPNSPADSAEQQALLDDVYALDFKIEALDAGDEITYETPGQQFARQFGSAMKVATWPAKKTGELGWWGAKKTATGAGYGLGYGALGIGVSVLGLGVGAYKIAEKSVVAAWRSVKAVGNLLWDIGENISAGNWEMGGGGGKSFGDYFSSYYKTLRPEEKQEPKN